MNVGNRPHSLGGRATGARLGTSQDLTPFLGVQIRSSVPGDERFSHGTLSRLWTYQVKVAKERDPGAEWTPGSAWTENAWAKKAIGLPTLRVVEPKGSLYALDAYSRLY